MGSKNKIDPMGGAEGDPTHGESVAACPADAFDAKVSQPLDLLKRSFISYIEELTRKRHGFGDGVADDRDPISNEEMAGIRCGFAEEPRRREHGAAKAYVFTLKANGVYQARQLYGALSDAFDKSDASVNLLPGTEIVTVFMTENFLNETFGEETEVYYPSEEEMQFLTGMLLERFRFENAQIDLTSNGLIVSGLSEDDFQNFVTYLQSKEIGFESLVNGDRKIIVADTHLRALLSDSMSYRDGIIAGVEAFRRSIGDEVLWQVNEGVKKVDIVLQ